MGELNYKELQEKGVFDVPYKAFQFMQHQQAKIDELQRRNQMLSDNIKEQGQKLVYQNEVIETQAEKLLGLRDEKADLQERIDKALSITGNYCDEDDAALLIYVLEKALRGEE